MGESGRHRISGGPVVIQGRSRLGDQPTRRTNLRAGRKKTRKLRSTSSPGEARLDATVNNAKYVIQVSKGLIRHARARRLVMFYSVLAALVMLFAGAVTHWPEPREHPLLFLGYWAVCGWITFLAVLLALYDLVKVRAEAQRLRRDLTQDHFEKKGNDENPR